MTPSIVLGGIELVKLAVDRIWPDKTEEEKQQLAAAVAAVNGQLEINKEEAKNPSMFVAGWRPGSGWICNAGLAYTFILQPLLAWGCSVKGWPIPPKIDVDVLMFLLTSLLGIGSLRTVEKIKGKA